MAVFIQYNNWEDFVRKRMRKNQIRLEVSEEDSTARLISSLVFMFTSGPFL